MKTNFSLSLFLPFSLSFSLTFSLLPYPGSVGAYTVYPILARAADTSR